MRGFREILGSEYKNEKVPLYRSYGVWRKTHPVLDKILFYALRSVVIFVLAVLGIAFFTTAWSLLFYADILIATVFLLGVILIFALIFTRTIRKRLKLIRKIKRLCKKEGYALRWERGFFSSLRWHDSSPDFILETDKYVYHVHFLTINKYTSSLTFKSSERIEKVVYPLNNKFTLIFEFKPRRSTLKTAFTPLPSEGKKQNIRVLLVNPVCRDMFEASADGGVITTGNGMQRFGYTVFSGSGFIEAVKRNEQGDI